MIKSPASYWGGCIYAIVTLSQDKQQRTRIHKNIILYFYSSTGTFVWNAQERCRESEQPAGSEFQPTF